MECLYAGVMLPDYWQGCDLAHVSICAWQTMTAEDVKTAIKNELESCAVLGSEYGDDLHDAYMQAVDDLEILSDQPFLGCELEDESMAFFVFKKD